MGRKFQCLEGYGTTGRMQSSWQEISRKAPEGLQRTQTLEKVPEVQAGHGGAGVEGCDRKCPRRFKQKSRAQGRSVT